MDAPTIDPQLSPEIAPTPIEGGNLPSAVEQRTIDDASWTLNENRQSKYFKDGKAYGRFDNIDGVFDALKSIEDKYANVMRDIKTPPTPSTATVDTNSILQSLIPDFMSAGMQLTPEIEAKATAAGVDIRDLKLGAMEFRDTITASTQKAHAVVGGKDEYDAMIEWGKANLTDDQKVAFDQGLTSAYGEYAIKGLYADFKAASTGTTPQLDRVRGDNSASAGTTGGYGTREEVMRDRAYLNSRQGQSDKAAREVHERKLSRTPDSVIYGR